MEVLILAALLLLGIALVIAEIIFVPGTTLVGILGFVCLIGGIYLVYDGFGTKYGHITLIGTGSLIIVLIIYSLKSNTWKGMALDQQITSKVNDGDEFNINEGCIAVTISNLRPIGTIEFENEQFEAESEGEFIDANTTVKVVKINNKQIIVKPQT